MACIINIKSISISIYHVKLCKKYEITNNVFQIEEPREQIQSRSLSGDKDVLAKMFARHDVQETSYHLLAPRIDLHLCDDPGR